MPAQGGTSATSATGGGAGRVGGARLSLRDIQAESLKQGNFKITEGKSQYFKRNDSKMLNDIRREIKRSFSSESLSDAQLKKSAAIAKKKEDKSGQAELSKMLRKGKTVSFASGSPEKIAISGKNKAATAAM